MSNRFTPEESLEPVPFADVVAASIQIYDEWEFIEENRDALPAEERAAYQEGLLFALRAVNAQAGVSVATLPDGALAHLGAEQEREDPDAHMEPPDDCGECGGARVRSLGAEGAICPSCDH